MKKKGGRGEQGVVEKRKVITMAMAMDIYSCSHRHGIKKRSDILIAKLTIDAVNVHVSVCLSVCYLHPPSSSSLTTLSTLSCFCNLQGERGVDDLKHLVFNEAKCSLPLSTRRQSSSSSSTFSVLRQTAVDNNHSRPLRCYSSSGSPLFIFFFCFLFSLAIPLFRYTFSSHTSLLLILFTLLYSTCHPQLVLSLPKATKVNFSRFFLNSYLPSFSNVTKLSNCHSQFATSTFFTLLSLPSPFFSQ